MNIISLVRDIFVNTAHAASFPEVVPGQNLGEFIKNIYSFAIGLVGLAVFVQFLRAGFSYFLAAGNVAEAGSSKSMMQNAILGGILLLSAYLILNVINPDLTDVSFAVPTLPPPPSGVSTVPKGRVVDQGAARRDLIANDISAYDVNLEGISSATVNEIKAMKRLCLCDFSITGYTKTTSGDSVKIHMTATEHYKFVTDFIYDETTPMEGTYVTTGAIAVGSKYQMGDVGTYFYETPYDWNITIKSEVKVDTIDAAEGEDSRY